MKMFILNPSWGISKNVSKDSFLSYVLALHFNMFNDYTKK